MENWNDFRKKTHSCWFLTGPTACGKSRLSISLANRLEAEIIALDSMTVYREMDVGTAKVMQEQRKGIPHHLIDIVDPCEEYSLARYVREAYEKIDEIQSRGNQVLFVGGTPLYLKAMLRGVFEGPEADKEFREELQRRMIGNPPDLLHKMLQKVDPETAKRLHQNDIRRIVRALEVYELTGKPISSFQKQFEDSTPAENCHVYVLQMPREALYEKIDKRVDRMMYDGFLDEVKMLAERRTPIGHTARQALGYKELFDYLDGAMKFGEAVNLIKQNTRHYAKHQETWFRSITECRFTSAENPEFEGLIDIGNEGDESIQSPEIDDSDE
ncbi:MAG: tRNA (adenosine(37)-N6)-dimethylallyltransferase MiaA [Thermoguttaceae bacterium]